MKVEKLWIVTKPSPHSEMHDICFEATLKSLEYQFLGGLKSSEIEGVFTDEAEARKLAKQLLPEVKAGLNQYQLAAALIRAGVEIVGMRARVQTLTDANYDDVKGDEPEAKDLKRLADIEDKAAGDYDKALKLALNVANSITDKDKAIRRAKAAKIVVKDIKLGKLLHDVFMKRAKSITAGAGIAEIESSHGVYDLIQKLKGLPGVFIGDYSYELDGEVVEGHKDYRTSELVKGQEFEPVVKILCVDGWLDVQDTKGQATKMLK